MARSYQRPVRLDDDLKPFVDSLPRGTVNSLINQLLHLYKDNKAIREMVSIKDDRFANYVVEDSPQVDNPGETVEKPAPQPVNVLDEIVPT